jgi:hypothetical protein
LFFFKIENRLIPTDLRSEALALQKNIDWKDPGADGNKNEISILTLE